MMMSPMAMGQDVVPVLTERTAGIGTPGHILRRIEP